MVSPHRDLREGAYVAMIETGKRRNPSLMLLQRLAKVLGVPVTKLLE